jgi:hypothetical protein
MNYHIGRLVLSSLCVGPFGAAGFWWCSFCRLQPVTMDVKEIGFWGTHWINLAQDTDKWWALVNTETNIPVL